MEQEQAQKIMREINSSPALTNVFCPLINGSCKIVCIGFQPARHYFNKYSSPKGEWHVLSPMCNVLINGSATRDLLSKKQLEDME